MNFTLMTTGKYGGIGSLVRNNGDYTIISEVYKDFPADKAGIRAGDLLKKGRRGIDKRSDHRKS